jgi:hypothetical protein
MTKALDQVVWERAIEIMNAGWTQNAMARDARGEVAPIQSKEAVAFCAYGALIRAAHEIGWAPYPIYGMRR